MAVTRLLRARLIWERSERRADEVGPGWGVQTGSAPRAMEAWAGESARRAEAAGGDE